MTHPLQKFDINKWDSNKTISENQEIQGMSYSRVQKYVQDLKLPHKVNKRKRYKDYEHSDQFLNGKKVTLTDQQKQRETLIDEGPGDNWCNWR